MQYDEYVVNVHSHTGTDVTTLPLATIVSYTNEFLPTLSAKINKVNNTILGIEATNDLVEDQREYPLPSDKESLVSVEAKLQDEGTKWITLFNLDMSIDDLPRDEASVISRFYNSQGRSFFTPFRDSMYVLSGTIPTPDTLDGDNAGSDGVSDGLKLWYLGSIEAITTTQLATSNDMSATPGTGATNWKHGIPEIFHELVARYVRIKWKTSADRNISLDEHELLFDTDLKDTIEGIRNIDKNKELDISPPSTVSEGNNGYDY